MLRGEDCRPLEQGAEMSTATETTKEILAIAHGQSLGLTGTGALSIPLPFESKIVLCESVRVAGTTHTPNIANIMREMPEDARLVFFREPDNQADPWAIRVEYGGRKIGYMPADKNELIARLMDGGKTVRGSLKEKELQGNWWKVYMEVSLID